MTRQPARNPRTLNRGLLIRSPFRAPGVRLLTDGWGQPITVGKRHAKRQNDMADKRHNGLTTADELARLVDSVEDYAMFLLEPNGGIRSWNRGAARIFGYSDGEVIGRPFSIFYSADDIAAGRPARELEKAASAGKVEDDGWRIRKNGE